MRTEPVKQGTRARLDDVTKKWWLYALLLLLFFIPTYAARNYAPRQAVDLIGQVLSAPLIYAFPILMPAAKIVTVLVILGVWIYGNQMRRAFNVYVAVLYLAIALFQTTAVTDVIYFRTRKSVSLHSRY